MPPRATTANSCSRVKADGFQHVAGAAHRPAPPQEFGFCQPASTAPWTTPTARARVSGPPGVPHRRDHPQPARQRTAARCAASASSRIRASRWSPLTPNDVVILPAFGITVELLQQLTGYGCTLRATRRCGSVLNVWKNVKRYAQDGFTSVIHGKATGTRKRGHGQPAQPHRATATALPACVDHAQARQACDYIRTVAIGRRSATRSARPCRRTSTRTCTCSASAARNQTTMLSSESLEIGEMLRGAMRERNGDDELPTRFRAFDTICSATQERQDAVVALLADHRARPDAGARRLQQQQHLQNLARICAAQLALTFHVRIRTPAVAAR